MALAMAVLALTLGIVSCGSDDPQVAIDEQLEKLAGRDLTRAEIASQLELADLMCGFDGDLLVEIWARLDSRQLEFQDFVFGERCPDRVSVYEDARPNMGTVAPENTTTTTEPVALPPGFLESIDPVTTTTPRRTTTTSPEDTDDSDDATEADADESTTTESGSDEPDTNTTTSGAAATSEATTTTADDTTTSSDTTPPDDD